MQRRFCPAVEVKNNHILGTVDGVKQTANLPRIFMSEYDERESHRGMALGVN